MSLTGHLQDPDSPLRRYFAQVYPNVRQIRVHGFGEKVEDLGAEGQTVVTHLPGRLADRTPRLLPTDERGYPWAAAGNALDYWIQHELGVIDLPTSAASKGWLELVREPRGQRASDTGWPSLVTALSSFSATVGYGVEMSEGQETELARYCGLLALYEHVYRMGGILSPYFESSPLVKVGLNQELEGLLGLVDPRLPVDIVALGRETRMALDLGAGGVAHADPSFARSRDLGGADADLIIRGELVEVKTTKAAKISAQFAWQVLGYLLADTEDVYEIRDVGWYFARHGLRWMFPASEFLARLAGHDVELARARADFAEVCAEFARPRPVRRDAPSTADGADDSATRPGSSSAAHPGSSAVVERLVSFYPATSGAGRLHAPTGQVPFLSASAFFDGTPEDPACGSTVTLDVSATPSQPPIGAPHSNLDARFCRRCLLYTARFFGGSGEPVAADLPYYPSAQGRGKWHARAGDTGYRVFGSVDDPACGARVILNKTVSPLRRAGDGRHDERICLRCLDIPVREADPGAGAVVEDDLD